MMRLIFISHPVRLKDAIYRVCLLSFSLILALSWLTTYAQTPPIAWVVDGSLSVNGQQITIENSCCALFSPEHTKLAYLDTTDTSQNLVILDAAAPQTPLFTFSAETFAPDSRLGYLAWQNENLLWLTTFEWKPAEGIYAPLARWDLWRVDATTGQVTPFQSAGNGGVAFPSPDGTRVAVVNPGNYGTQTASIKIYDEAGTQTAFYSYPAVSSASEQAWIPEIQWVGEGVRFIVPDADLVYSTDPAALPATLLMELTPQQISALGEIQVDFPAQVQWSPDGTQIAYTRRVSLESFQTDVFVWDVSRQTETRIFESDTYISLLSWDDVLVYYLPETAQLTLWTPEKQQLFENVRDFISLGNGTGLIVQGNFETTQISYLVNGQLTPVADVIGTASLAR